MSGGRRQTDDSCSRFGSRWLRYVPWRGCSSASRLDDFEKLSLWNKAPRPPRRCGFPLLAIQQTKHKAVSRRFRKHARKLLLQSVRELCFDLDRTADGCFASGPWNPALGRRGFSSVLDCLYSSLSDHRTRDHASAMNSRRNLRTEYYPCPSVHPGEEERHGPRPVLSGTSVSLGRFETGRGAMH